MPIWRDNLFNNKARMLEFMTFSFLIRWIIVEIFSREQTFSFLFCLIILQKCETPTRVGIRCPLGFLLSKHPVSNRGPLRFLLSGNPVSIQLLTGFLLSKHPVAHWISTNSSHIIFNFDQKVYKSRESQQQLKLKTCLKCAFVHRNAKLFSFSQGADKCVSWH